MSQKDTYTQCDLMKAGHIQTAWIPSSFAVENKIIKVKNKGVWGDGWLVLRTYGTRSAEQIEEAERDYVSVGQKIK